MKNKIKILSASQLDTLKSKFDALRFNNEFELVYESQVPNTGIVLLEGGLILSKKKKVQAILEPGTLIGIENLLSNEPSKVGCKVLKNSELILLNKSEILEAMNDNNSEIHAIIKDR